MLLTESVNVGDILDGNTKAPSISTESKFRTSFENDRLSLSLANFFCFYPYVIYTIEDSFSADLPIPSFGLLACAK